MKSIFRFLCFFALFTSLALATPPPRAKNFSGSLKRHGLWRSAISDGIRVQNFEKNKKRYDLRFRMRVQAVAMVTLARQLNEALPIAERVIAERTPHENERLQMMFEEVLTQVNEAVQPPAFWIEKAKAAQGEFGTELHNIETFHGELTTELKKLQSLQNETK